MRECRRRLYGFEGVMSCGVCCMFGMEGVGNGCERLLYVMEGCFFERVLCVC